MELTALVALYSTTWKAFNGLYFYRRKSTMCACRSSRYYTSARLTNKSIGVLNRIRRSMQTSENPEIDRKCVFGDVLCSTIRWCVHDTVFHLWDCGWDDLDFDGYGAQKSTHALILV